MRGSIRRSFAILAIAAPAMGMEQPVPAVPSLCADSPIIREAIAAYGEEPRLRFVYSGENVIPDQSAHPLGPYRAHPWTVRLAVDEARQQVSADNVQAIDGDFAFRERQAFADGKGFALDYDGRVEPLTAYPRPHAPYLPVFVLKTAAASAHCEVIGSDPAGVVVKVADYPASPRQLVIDRASKRLARINRDPVPSAFGPVSRDTIFSDYREVGGHWLPGRIDHLATDAVHGTTRSWLKLTEAAGGGPNQAELTQPLKAPAAAPPDREYRAIALAENVYLLRNASTEGRLSYNILAVVADQGVILVESGLNDGTAKRAIDEAARLAPGKPIMALVQTHMHGDHIGGIRTYLARGTPIIAPRGTSELFAKISGLMQPPPATSSAIREITGHAVIGDASNPIHLYDFPSGHADHMLIVHLPRAGVLYQGDLVSAGEIPPNATTRTFLDWLGKRRLNVEKLAGLHGGLLVGDELRTLLTGAGSGSR